MAMILDGSFAHHYPRKVSIKWKPLIHRLREELEQKQKHEVETFPTTNTTPYNPHIDQEKENLKKQVRELKQLLQHRFITFHSKKFENELRTCIMSAGYYKIYFNERMEMTKIAC
jgi:hypothetical protein